MNCILFFFRVAGTTGAVLTCPLEVVKTRLQSSNAFLPYPSNKYPRSTDLSGIQSSSSSLQNDALRRPEQRRKFSSTILRRIRPQVTECVNRGVRKLKILLKSSSESLMLQ